MSSSLDDIMAAIEERDRGAVTLPRDVARWDTALCAEVRRLRGWLNLLRAYPQARRALDGEGVP